MFYHVWSYYIVTCHTYKLVKDQSFSMIIFSSHLHYMVVMDGCHGWLSWKVVIDMHIPQLVSLNIYALMLLQKMYLFPYNFIGSIYFPLTLSVVLVPSMLQNYCSFFHLFCVIALLFTKIC